VQLINQINANQKLIPVGDEILENVFKNVEDNLMSLSKVLSSLYFQSLASQQHSSGTSNQPASQSGGNFLAPPTIQSHHAQQASGSVRFFFTKKKFTFNEFFLHALIIQIELRFSNDGPAVERQQDPLEQI
jgi:hypothetical protein